MVQVAQVAAATSSDCVVPWACPGKELSFSSSSAVQVRVRVVNTHTGSERLREGKREGKREGEGERGSQQAITSNPVKNPTIV